MVETIKNRSEIVFLYDVTDANPNGDPMDENRPRIDEETEINIVTDVRLKRTIRDYLRDYREQNIFIQPEKVIEKGEELIKTRGAKLEEELCEIVGKEKRLTEEEIKKIEQNMHSILDKKKSKNDRAEMFKKCLEDKRKDDDKSNIFEKFEEMRTTRIKQEVFKKFIDLRLFGATLAVASVGIQETGPVQFKFGRSLHKVDSTFYKGSITMPVEPAKGYETGKRQAEFSEEYRLPYSLIGFYGIINENASQNTGLTENDVNLFMDGIWNGTKNLITRSKVGQIPRFLLRVIYKDKNYHIGDLDKKIKLVGSKDNKEIKDGKEIRYISEVKLDVNSLINTLKENKDKIGKIEYEVNSDVVFLVDGEDAKGNAIEKKLKIDKISIKRLNLEITPAKEA